MRVWVLVREGVEGLVCMEEGGRKGKGAKTNQCLAVEPYDGADLDRSTCQGSLESVRPSRGPTVQYEPFVG